VRCLVIAALGAEAPRKPLARRSSGVRLVAGGSEWRIGEALT